MYQNTSNFIELFVNQIFIPTYNCHRISLKLTDLENAFVSCDDVEDGWKLDLYHLVENLLLADELTSKVNLDFLSFVEEEEFFFFFFNVILGAWTHIIRLTLLLIKMVHYKRNYLEQVRKNKKVPEAKYATYGYFLALQYCAYGSQNPRMLSWSSDKVSSIKELAELFKSNDVCIFSNYLDNFFIYFLKGNFYFFYCSQLHI